MGFDSLWNSFLSKTGFVIDGNVERFAANIFPGDPLGMHGCDLLTGPNWILVGDTFGLAIGTQSLDEGRLRIELIDPGWYWR